MIFKRSMTALFSLLIAPNISSSLANEYSSSAVELLSAFSGKSALQYEAAFQFSKDTRIISIDIHAVGMENVTAQYSGQEGAYHEVNNILRIKTADGFEGVSGVDTYYQDGFSDAHMQELQKAVDDLITFSSFDPVEVSLMLKRSRPNLSHEARASIDIALWDLAARRSGLPLYELLGATRNSMESYASLPFYKSLPEYVAAVREYAKLGFTIFKFHVWGSIEEDLRLVELIQQTFANSPYSFMVDLESAYTFEEAIRLGKQMDEGLFFWFEAPIADGELEQYHQLKKRLSVAIIPAGYNIYSREFIRQGIEADAWDAGRFDSTVVGGISEALELLIIANAAKISIDIQSWGHTLAQVVNLHLMLANERTRYFEAPMPKNVFEFGMNNGNLLDNSRVVAPKWPGLGIIVDWDHLATADFHSKTTIDL
ncbi:MAG: hypothetical protein OSB23_07455 [Porticoccaceae bacterium]|nr:hypothetical protein [Porticoccaceae bacterium]|tara:strand:+ start:2480 stop:3760 length:1281 start_codon:yes stop_codon:yes gene_type:complete